MPRYKLTIEYDGGGYNGWQKQQGQPSVQEALETAAQKFSQQVTEVIGAGRTDTGVHAAAQVAHIDLPKEMDPFRVMQGINFYLFCPHGNEAQVTAEPPSTNRIAVIAAERVSDDFHARFSATKRHYLYRIVNRRARLGLEAGRAWQVVEPLNVSAMREAAQYLIGHHDFTSFRDSECQSKSPVKTLEQLDIVQDGGGIHFIINARSFLHHQVRIMVGSLSMVGKGKWQPRDIQKALDARDRSQAGPTAPPDGLYLTRVDY